MADLTHAEVKRLWKKMTPQHRRRVQAKASWEAMSLWAVLNEWPSLRACDGADCEDFSD